MARSLVLAGLADEPTTIHNPLVARDSVLMADALRSLGCTVLTPAEGPWRVEPGRTRQPSSVDCGLSGTVMRFVPPVAALVPASVAFDGDPRARQRPMTGLLDALRALGVRLSPADARGLPVVVHGEAAVRGGSVEVDASESSQYVSGLLLAGANYTEGLEVTAVGVPPSTPHIAMTLAVLRERGVDAAEVTPTTWRVCPGRPRGGEVTIEPDMSNAAPFLAAALVTGGRVRAPGWPRRTTQTGPALLNLLVRFGASVDQDDDGVTVTGTTRLKGLGEVDLSEVGELTPTIAALAALASTPTTIRGVGHLRGHETDRLAALCAALHSMGGRVQVTPDGLHIEPTPLHAATVRSEGDHRMATFAAVLGLVVPGVVVDDVSVTGKTMPTFTRLWQDMLG